VRRAAVLALLIVAPLVAACGGGDDDDGPAASELDQRVVDGATPVSGDSMDSERWLKRQIFTLRLPAIAACVEERGYPELAAVAEDEFEYNLNIYSAAFPEPDRLLAEGLNPDWGPTPYQPTPPPSAAPEPGQRASVDVDASDKAFSECQAPEGLEPDAARATELYQGLLDQWAPIVHDHQVVREGDLVEGVGECLRDKGVPAEYTEPRREQAAGGTVDLTVENAFGTWVAQRVRAGTVSQTAIEDAPILVECAQPLWDQREAELLDERESFVEEHREQLAELGDLVSD
jgi:hypothetical protein